MYSELRIIARPEATSAAALMGLIEFVMDTAFWFRRITVSASLETLSLFRFLFSSFPRPFFFFFSFLSTGFVGVDETVEAAPPPSPRHTKKRIAEPDVGSPGPVRACIDSLSCGTRFLSLEFSAERKNHPSLRPVRSVTQPNAGQDTELATKAKNGA